jgi:hypothetical protein
MQTDTHHIHTHTHTHKLAQVYWTTAAPKEGCAHQEDESSTLNLNPCINTHLSQTHFNITFRSTPGTPMYQATSHWGFRINVSQACTILIVPFVLYVPLTMHTKIHDQGHLGAPAPSTAVTSAPPPPTWFPGKQRPFSADCAEQITIGSPVFTAAQVHTRRLCQTSQRSVMCKHLRPFQSAINTSCSIQPHFWRHFTSGLPSYKEWNCRSATKGTPCRYGPKVNPLTPELNPSEQLCLPEFFTGDFKFYCLLLKKSISPRLFLQI